MGPKAGEINDSEWGCGLLLKWHFFPANMHQRRHSRPLWRWLTTKIHPPPSPINFNHCPLVLLFSTKGKPGFSSFSFQDWWCSNGNQNVSTYRVLLMLQILRMRKKNIGKRILLNVYNSYFSFKNNTSVSFYESLFQSGTSIPECV